MFLGTHSFPSLCIEHRASRIFSLSLSHFHSSLPAHKKKNFFLKKGALPQKKKVQKKGGHEKYCTLYGTETKNMNKKSKGGFLKPPHPPNPPNPPFYSIPNTHHSSPPSQTKKRKKEKEKAQKKGKEVRSSKFQVPSCMIKIILLQDK